MAKAQKEMMAREANPYPLRTKAKAFLKGLPKLEPLLQVAREGLKRNVSDKERERYLNRIANSGTTDDVVEVMTERLDRPPPQLPPGVFRDIIVHPDMDEKLQTALASRVSEECNAIKGIKCLLPLELPSSTKAIINSPMTRSAAITGGTYAALNTLLPPNLTLGLTEAARAFILQAHSMPADVFVDSTPIPLIYKLTAVTALLSFAFLAAIRIDKSRWKLEENVDKASRMLTEGDINSGRAQNILAGMVARLGTPYQAGDLFSDGEFVDEEVEVALAKRCLGKIELSDDS